MCPVLGWGWGWAGAGALPTRAVSTASPSFAPNRHISAWGCPSYGLAKAWLQPGYSLALRLDSGPPGAIPLLTGQVMTASWARPLLFQLFLYKALGTVLAACQNLRHVQGQVLSFLQATDPVSEPQVR